MRDRHADLADLAFGLRMVAVVAGLGRQIEGDRKAGLPLAQILAIKRVRSGRGRMPRIGAENPRFIAQGSRRGSSPIGFCTRVGTHSGAANVAWILLRRNTRGMRSRPKRSPRARPDRTIDVRRRTSVPAASAAAFRSNGARLRHNHTSATATASASVSPIARIVRAAEIGVRRQTVLTAMNAASRPLAPSRLARIPFRRVSV